MMWAEEEDDAFGRVAFGRRRKRGRQEEGGMRPTSYTGSWPLPNQLDYKGAVTLKGSRAEAAPEATWELDPPNQLVTGSNVIPKAIREGGLFVLPTL